MPIEFPPSYWEQTWTGRKGIQNELKCAILAAGLGILSMLSLAVGLILDTISKYHQDQIELWKRQLGG